MKKFWQNLVLLLASGFGFGLSPKAPGTLGSLWGGVLFVALHNGSPKLWWSVGAALVVLAVAVSEGAERIWQKKDDQRIVIDEVAGLWVAYSFVFAWGNPALTLINGIGGFALFRLFDIVKWFPARQAQNRIPGGLGVVADDLVAGVQAGIVLWIANFVYTQSV